MSNPANSQFESTGDAVVSGVEVPDMASPEWPSADLIFIHVEGQQAFGGFYAPQAEEADDISVIEFTIADIPTKNMLTEFEDEGMGLFDLNDLFVLDDSVVEGAMLPVSDGSAKESSVTEAPLEADLSLSEVHNMPLSMALPQLTIMIDDESDPNTVAI